MNLNDKIKLTKKINKLKKVELIHLIEAFINLDEIKNLNNNNDTYLPLKISYLRH